MKKYNVFIINPVDKKTHMLSVGAKGNLSFCKVTAKKHCDSMKAKGVNSWILEAN